MTFTCSPILLIRQSIIFIFILSPFPLEKCLFNYVVLMCANLTHFLLFNNTHSSYQIMNFVMMSSHMHITYFDYIHPSSSLFPFHLTFLFCNSTSFTLRFCLFILDCMYGRKHDICLTDFS